MTPTAESGPPLLAVAAVLAAVGLLFLAAAIVSFRRLRLAGGTANLLLALLLLATGTLSATVAVGTAGYRALTREDLAAVASTRPTGPQTFQTVLRWPDGRTDTFNLAGDQLYVDARILKWKPIANLIGLPTAYELDRVGGRYMDVRHEQTRPRTVFPLGADRPVDLFDLRRRFPVLRPLVDAEYGSASFAPADGPASYEIRVSTTGLLMRPETSLSAPPAP